MNLRAALRRYSELVAYKTYAELKAEASTYFLGMAWWILEPALYLLAFYGIFQWGTRQGEDDFIPFLLVGLIHWKWTASCLSNGSVSILHARGIIAQVYLPKIVFPVFSLAISTTKFLIILVLMLSVIAYLKGLSISALLWLLPVYMTHLLLLFGLASTLAILVPVIPDLQPIIDNGIIVLMLVSGIFFNIDSFPEDAQFWFYSNPFAVLFSEYRNILLAGLPPKLSSLAYVTAIGVFMSAVATWLHVRLNRRIPRVLF